jgi:hypothetical protein
MYGLCIPYIVPQVEYLVRLFPEDGTLHGPEVPMGIGKYQYLHDFSTFPVPPHRLKRERRVPT